MLQCLKCQSEIVAEDIHLGNMLAKCRRCNEVFSFAGQVVTPIVTPPLAARDTAPTPPDVTVIDDEEAHSITRNWFHPGVFMMALFCIAWDSFLVFWYIAGIEGNGPWLMLVFPIVHVAVGVSLTYATLATIVNRTVVKIASGRLIVWHGPMPWGGNRNLPVDEIRAVFCNHANAREETTKTGNYTVNAILMDNTRIVLLTGIADLPAAKFYEDRLETWLGLPPEPVAGECS